jgi:hypothetical protein
MSRIGVKSKKCKNIKDKSKFKIKNLNKILFLKGMIIYPHGGSSVGTGESG